ncbi:MAG: riboflavin biosynthesis protein RibF [Firmicutes bacterium]|nr:riboflavin biosynthesis protein RibF [Bacillota bacterium]
MRQIDTSTKNATSKKPKAVIALGYFDCVHLGHRAIFETAKRLAQENKAKLAAMTFADNDFSCLVKSSKQLYSFDTRLGLFADCGVDIVLPYVYSDIKNLSPQEFLQRLFSTIGASVVVCGFDFRFGHKGKGDVELLDRYCMQNGVSLELVSSQIYLGERVSTTVIKDCLQNTNFDKANALLCKPYFASGKVQKGRCVGRTLGFPTANIDIAPHLFCLPEGVYGTTTQLSDGSEYKSITNIGGKPTYDIATKNMETHLMGFEGDLYGQVIQVNFYQKLRDIKKFEGVDALTTQLHLDKELWENREMVAQDRAGGHQNENDTSEVATLGSFVATKSS